VTWSIDVRRPAELPATSRYLARVGRALFLASMFEEQCKSFLTLVEIFKRAELLESDAALALEHSLKKKRLAEAIAKFVDITRVKQEHVDALHKARLARNWIAHEAALLGPLSTVSSTTLVEQTKELRTQVDLLVAGDMIVSVWADAAERGRNAGESTLHIIYPDLAASWVMHGKLPVAKLQTDLVHLFPRRK
jgi:hypothetical protein